MKDLSGRIAALSPQQRAMFELLRSKQPRKAPAGPPQGPIPRRETPGPAPLSFDQERIWFLHQLDPQETAYNVATITKIRGRLDLPRLIAALNEVVRRHESWRTVLPAVDGRPVQVVLPHLELHAPVVDLREIPAERRQALSPEIARDLARQPFDFDRGPLVRAVLVHQADEEHDCILAVHHIVTDWISSQIAWGELAAIYLAFLAGKPSPLPELPVQYADFAVWQREWMQGEALQRYLDFWVEEIAGAPHALELPTDRPRPPFQTTRGAQAQLWVPADRTEALRTLARQERATSFMAFLSIYGALLHRLTGEAKVLISAPNANRNRMEIQPLIGFFLSQILFAVDSSEDPTFRELLQRVRGTALRTFAHQDLPFGKLVEAVRPERDPSRAPLVQVNLLVLDTEGSSSSIEMPGLVFEEIVLEEDVAKFDLGLAVLEGSGELTGFVEYNRDLFDRTTAERLARAFETLVDQVGRNPDLRVSELRLLEEGALHQVLREWNDTGVSEPALPVHQLVEEQAERAPEAVALVTPDGEITYGELNRRAGLLAAWLNRQGIGPEARIGLCVDRTADVAVGMLGIWKAGAAWVPLDPAYPADRLAYILDDAGLAAVVTRSGPAARLPETSTPLLSLDELEQEVLPPSPGRAGGDGRGAGGEGLAYVIYTSGTTGQPKGVLVEHGNLAHALRASRREFGWRADDRIPVLAPFSFDIFLFELWSPLTAGGVAELVPLAPALDLPRLMAGLESATRLHAVPALMRQIVALARAEGKTEGKRWPGVRTVFVGGDAVPPELLADLPEVFPTAEIRVLYGPTEGTIICASLRANDLPWRDHGPKTLLGRPLPDAELRLVDRSGGIAAIGVAGELWIGGPGVTRGYLGRPELTAERFSAGNPTDRTDRSDRSDRSDRFYRTGDLARWLPDGLLEFLGRVDEQVKVRGFRIEPGEIEAALLEHPAIREAVVLAAAVEGGDKRLVAYVVPDVDGGGWEETEEAVRAALTRRLPEHMVPSAFVPLPELPLTGHGKVDRRALLKLGSAAAAGPAAATAPRTPAEEVLAEIWSGLLGVERVGIHDNFFRLGGDSILGIQVVARARQAGLVITPRQIFENQTIAALAAVAETAGEDAEPEEGPVEGEVPLTPVQLRFFEEEPVDPDWFNQSLLLDVRLPLEPGALDGALQALAARHDALRWRAGGGSSAFIQPVATIPFVQVDLSALPEEVFSQAVEAASAQLQTAFDLQNGPVFLAALFSDGTLRRLLLAAHHLVVDAVSWRILLEDLQTAYGQPEALPPRTTSWKRWAERLRAYARSAAVRKELEHWLAVPAPAELPADLPGTPEDDTMGAADTVLVGLPAEATTALLREAPVPYRARVDDLLLTALTQAFAQWTGEPRLVLELEGHGREEIEIGRGAIDLSRIVGWFTTVYPVALDLAGTHGPGQAIKAVKEQLRAIPGKGLSYGLLRYSGVGGDRRLTARPEPQVGFNYLGQLDAVLPAGGAFAPAPEPAGPEQSPRARRRHRIDVDALVWEGRLRVNFTYAARLLARETMERLAKGFSAALQELIAHCLAPEAGGWTPSDLPLARLAPAEVDALLGSDPAVEDVYPLAPLQSGMLFHTLYTPGSEIYFEQLTATLRGPLDVAAFARAWQAVVDRQPVLRTAFAWEGLKRPLQIVRRGVEVPWTLEDWRGDADAEARFQAYVLADQVRGFDLARAPLLRFALIRTGDGAHRLLWSFHHLLFDGWCFSILFREVFTGYEAFRRGEAPVFEPVRPYRDYLAWLDRQDPARAEAFWRGRLAGFAGGSAATPVPFDDPEAPAGRSVTDFREVEVRLPGPRARGLARVAQEGGLTLNTLVQGAWALLLARWSGRREVVFGAVAAGRPADLPGVESMVGLFINTLPVRAEIDPEEPVLAWLRRLQEEQVEQRAFEWSPLSDVQRWSELPPGAPLFHSLLVFENYPVDPSIGEHLGELEIGDVRVSERSNYPLTLAVVARDEILLRLGFDARVTPETAERILAQLETVLAAFSENPEWTLGSVPVLPGEENLRALTEASVHRSAAAPEAAHEEAPRNGVEEALSRIWRGVLRLDQIGIHEDFFRLGGDSILSLQIVARARQEGLVVTPRQIFEHPTIAGLAAVAQPVAEGEMPAIHSTAGPGLPLVRLDPAVRDAVFGGDPSIEDLYPLAPLQRAMLVHGLYAPESPLYLEQLSCVLRGGLDEALFRRAWQGVTDHHPALRTAFAWQGLDEPLQVVRRGVELTWKSEDWRGVPAEEQRARWQERLDEDMRRVFDLGRPPLQRVLLVRTADGEHRLLWTFHHLLFDGWCFSPLFRDLFQLYLGLAHGEEEPRLPVPRPYRDFIAWLAEKPVEASEGWWRRRLEGFTAPTPLPLDFSGVEPGERVRFLSASSTAALEAFLQSRRLTVNTLFQGGWGLLLSRYGGGRDVLFGSVTSGRPPELPGVEAMIGLFINTLALRLDVDPDAPAAAWLRGVQEALLDVRQHEHVPAAAVQNWSELPPGEPLFHSITVFERFPYHEALAHEARGLEVEELLVRDRADVPLSAVASPSGERLGLMISHDHQTEPATVERLLRHLEALLVGLAADPDRPLRDVPLLDEAERSQLLAWGEEGWRIEEPVVEDDLPVHERFARRAAERPEAPALLTMDGAVISYGELVQRVGRLAGTLREMGVGPEARVGVWLERSPRMIEAVLAVHIAGGAYVPIDPEAPPERVAFLLEDSGALVLLTQESLAASLPPVRARVVSSFGSLESFRSFSSLANLAYVLYTSGSTGTPKGVLVTHRALAAYVRAVSAIYGLGPSDRAMQFASLSFDASAEEIFTALTTGASLVVRSGPAEDAATFLQRCADLGLTLLSLPTAYWHLLAAALESGEAEWPAGLRVVVMGGERALPERWAAWGRGPGFRPRLFNAYGPTEATIGATFQEHPGGALPVREVPIGRPLPGWRAHVLDADLRPLPLGATGELFLGGVGLARGYLGDPAQTAERFLPDPTDRSDPSNRSDSAAPGRRLYRTGDRARWLPDGTLEFAGRIDAQVKVRGFRIELGEVEAALAAHPEVREAAAVTRVEASGNARLLAFVVWRGEAGDAAGLRYALERRLPAWMVPSEIVALDALPVTAAGKLDRRALERMAPEAGTAAREIRPPSNPVEEGLAEIWSELLGVERVGLDDDFFALGGHSLLATQLVSRVRQRFGVDLPLHGLFELRTLEDLAREVLARTLEEGEGDGEMDRILAELDDLSDEEALALLAEEESGTGADS
ncbi:MAG TPA: amino acid adenylation domain-containing protein [Thermoanaerobaculia bacterium]|nr:amino acid adenylation domain-containing protein [Thermoanaerobaculia bacterium]